jgi:hypothetical protein
VCYLIAAIAVIAAGIVPKMAVRFSSFDALKTALDCQDGKDKSECSKPLQPRHNL